MGRLLIPVLVLFLLSHSPAYAYIDPGAASIALQAIIGAVAVAGMYFRSYLFRFLSLFRGQTKNNLKPDATSNDDKLKTESHNDD